jgi:hypothetical protein
LFPDIAIGTCTGSIPHGITWVEFADPGQYQRPVEHARTRHIGVDGNPATETTGRVQGNAVVVVDVRAASARVTVHSPSAQHAERIADTLAVVDVDSHGCVTRATYEPLPATPPPARPAARHELIPGQPTSMAVCGYDPGGLGGSGEVPALSLAADLAMLRGLPPGYSVARGHPGSCTDTPDAADSLDRGGDWYAVLVHYHDGPTLVLHARIGTCGYLGITNGSVSAQRGRFELTDFLIRPSHVSPGFPEYVVPVAR